MCGEVLEEQRIEVPMCDEVLRIDLLVREEVLDEQRIEVLMCEEVQEEQRIDLFGVLSDDVQYLQPEEAVNVTSVKRVSPKIGV